MKINFGVLIYNNLYYKKASSNIGDYIQSLAAMNIYKKIIQDFNNTNYEMRKFIKLAIENKIPNFNFVFIRRDNLHYKLSKLKNIITIMNGWWMHPYNESGDISFKIPSNITPIFISFHIANERLLTPVCLNELKKNQPIGCRDLKTTEKLKKKGIDVYFSGCLTTTIDFFKWKQQNNTIYNTDTKGKNGIYFRHENPKWKDVDYKQALCDALDILENYSKCRYVNTSRLHCYLPCLAMGVPVKFISPSGNPNIKSWGSKNRFDGLRELQKNPIKFIELKNKLERETIKICKNKI